MSNEPTLPGESRPASFFGLALAPLGRDLLTAWRGMAEWRALAWLWPRSAVCVYLPTGERLLSTSLEAAPVADDKRASSARLVAVQLPEELLLRRSLHLPQLQTAELQAAVAIEMQALSPFAQGDAIWGQDTGVRDGGGLQVAVVLSSRKLIENHLATVHPQRVAQNPEVWAGRAQAPGFLVLPGFGEARRQRQSALGRWGSAALVTLILAMLTGMAITPSAQLYLRAHKATEAMVELQKKAEPVMGQRQTLLQTAEQLSKLETLAGKLVSPLQIINLVTESLPDDTSLLTLQIQGSQVSMNGQTSNASALMKMLGGVPALHDVRAPVPAIKPLGAPRETFNLEFTVDTTQIKAAP